MKTIISITALSILVLNLFIQTTDYERLKADAEAQYNQGSYARAYEIYARVDKNKLGADESRWVEFRLADTTWRAQSQTETSDTTKLEQSQKQLDQVECVSDCNGGGGARVAG